MALETDITKMPKDVQVQAETLLMRPVRIVVVYKPTNESAMKEVSLRHCRAFFEAAVESMKKKHPEATDSDFVALQIDWQDKSVITSTL